jgi:hypothetical protein
MFLTLWILIVNSFDCYNRKRNTLTDVPLLVCFIIFLET